MSAEDLVRDAPAHGFSTPDVIAEVCRELDVPFRINGYRYWNTDERTRS